MANDLVAHGTPLPTNLALPKEENENLATEPTLMLVAQDIHALMESMVKNIHDSKKTEKEMAGYQDHAQGQQDKLSQFFLSEKNDSYNAGSRGKQKEQLNKYFQKKFVMQDWLTKSLGFFKNIAKSAGSFILDLLKFLAVMSLFGPEFLNGIIDFVINTIMMVVTMFIQAIPSIVMALFKIAEIVIALIPQILDSLSGVFAKLAERFKNTPIGEIFNFLSWLTSHNGPIQSIFRFLVDHLTLVLIVIGLIIATYIIYNVVLAISAAITWLKIDAEDVSTIATIALTVAMWLLGSPIALVIIGILILVGVFILLWKYGDQLWDMFTKLSTKWKIFIIILALMFLPITLIILAIWGLVKAVKYLIKHWDEIVDMISSIPNVFAEIGPKIWKYVRIFLLPFIYMFKFLTWQLNLFKRIALAVFQGIIDFFSDPKAFIKKIGTAIEDALKSAGNTLVSIIMTSKMYFDQIMDKISNYIGGAIDLMVDSIKHAFTGTSLSSRGYGISEIATARQLGAKAGLTNEETYKLLAGEPISDTRGKDQATIAALQSIARQKKDNPNVETDQILKQMLERMGASNPVYQATPAETVRHGG